MLFHATPAPVDTHLLAEGPLGDAERRRVDGAVALAPPGDLLVAGRDSLCTLSGGPVADRRTGRLFTVRVPARGLPTPTWYLAR